MKEYFTARETMMYLILPMFAVLTGLTISIFVINAMTSQKEVEIRNMDDGKDKSSAKLRLKVERMLYVFLSMFLAWSLTNMLSYAMQASECEEKRTDATLSDVVSSFGLEPGKEYPISVGDRTTAGSGRVDYGGLFYIKGAGEWTSGTSILVAFEGNNGSYVLEIPISKITFDIRPDVSEASMSIDVPKTPEPRSVAYWQHSYACGNSIWSYGWVLMDCTALPPNVVISDDMSRQGLAPIIADTFKESAGARITLSPSMYNDILGLKTTVE